jgi:type IV secretory pathway VirB10-like protein
MRRRSEFDDDDELEVFDPETDHLRQMRRHTLLLLWLSVACMLLAAGNVIIAMYVAPARTAAAKASGTVSEAPQDETVPSAGVRETTARPAPRTAQQTSPLATPLAAPQPAPQIDDTRERTTAAPASEAETPRVVQPESSRVAQATRSRRVAATTRVEPPSLPAPTPRIVDEAGPLDSPRRTAQWMVEAHGRRVAEQRALAAALFYEPGGSTARFWKEVASHIRETPAR